MIFLAKQVEYDDAELIAVSFAKNNLQTFEVSAKNILFLRIDGVTNDPPFSEVTIIITSKE